MTRPEGFVSPERVERFLALVTEGPGIRVGRETIWKAFAKVFPDRPHGPGEREWLMRFLEEGEEQGRLRLPARSGKRWDRTLLPAIPTSIDKVVEAKERRSTEWQQRPWHPELQWVISLSALSEAQVSFLEAVNKGLVERRFLTPAPLRYRSLELTGDEKRLGQMLTTSLFGEGRLSLEHLGCYPEVPPLAYEVVGEAPLALGFENAGPFHVALREIQKMPKAPYGVLIYGGGNEVRKSIAYIEGKGLELERIDYVGDLDAAGLRIGKGLEADQRAGRGAPVEVKPASAMHRMMLESAATFGFRDGWPSSGVIGEEDALGLTAHLGEDVREAVQRILGMGNRIPEEVLGPEEFTRALAMV
jgi:hypothetical protein